MSGENISRNMRMLPKVRRAFKSPAVWVDHQLRVESSNKHFQSEKLCGRKRHHQLKPVRHQQSTQNVFTQFSSFFISSKFSLSTHQILVLDTFRNCIIYSNIFSYYSSNKVFVALVYSFVL